MMLYIDRNNSSVLYRFLIDPVFRIWRHLILILSISIISINQAFSVFDYGIVKSRSGIFFLCIIYMISYCTVGYFNLFVLIPKYFLKKKYILFLAFMLLSMTLLLLVQYSFEYLALLFLQTAPAPTSIFNPENTMLIDISSAFITITLCIAGASVSVLIKHWVIDNQRISRLEKEHIQSELEQLKDQITPDFLFKILNRTSVLVKSEPKKANEMLMKLSMILRYQLYDCGRDKVLLNSEINFIQNYLNLRHLFCDDFMFEVVIEGNVNRTFLPPLLFIPFVQNSISHISKGEGGNYLLKVRFEAISNTINFWCNSTNEVSVNSPDLLNIKRRLNLLFPDKYSLNIVNSGNESNMIKLELNLE